MTTYDEIGGPSAVAAAVDLFYTKVLADDSLTPYFQTADMARLKAHQRAFIAAAIGGPEIYQGRPLAAAHASLGITKEAFVAVVDHLLAALIELSVPRDVVTQIGIQLGPLEQEIVSQ